MTGRVPLLGRRLTWFGPAVAAAMILLVGWMAAERIAAREKQAVATVTTKEHRLPGRTYTTTIIDRRPLVVPHATGEQWLLGLAMEGTGKEATVLVAQDFFERIAEGQAVAVTYREGLLSGIEILSVEPLPGGR